MNQINQTNQKDRTDFDVALNAVFTRHWLLEEDPLTFVPDGKPRPRLGSRRLAGHPPDSPMDIIGRYEAYVIVVHIDASIAHNALPPKCELLPPPNTPPGKHPVFYSFGSHFGVRPRFFSAFDYDYAEAIIGIPNVMFVHPDRKKSGPRFVMTAVRLDNFFAHAIGVGMGLPKQMADFTITDTKYAFEHKGAEVMKGEMVVSGNPFDENHPNFKQISPLMQQEVLSRTPVGGLLLGTPFKIDTANAFMEPATAQFEIINDSLPGLPKGTYSFPGIDQTAFGGGYLSRHDWRMSPPRLISE
jgi:hypothetical protein